MYKEDFESFQEALNEATNFIINEKGEEVISDSHQKDFQKPTSENSNNETDSQPGKEGQKAAAAYTDVNFDDI